MFFIGTINNMRAFDSLEHTQSTLNNLIKKIVGVCYLLNKSRKIKRIRKKERIRVLFVLTELGPWKTEILYLTMLKHPRFEPVLGVSTSPEDASFRKPLEQYLNQKKYEWKSINGRIISDEIQPDIIFYQKPYYSAYNEDIRYDRHWNALFCYVYYAFNSVELNFAFNVGLYNFAWQIYYENEMSAQSRRPLMKNKGKNIVVTGMPIQDMLLKPKSDFKDPWKPLGNLKRIIYAPHHTIGDIHFKGIEFSTFLSNAEAMLELAQKYQNRVQWAFKPHPLLYKNLVSVWGEERTEAYYQKWASLPNSQLELGRYESLFKYSDAMIHDCASFTIEYHYTLNPVLYLIKDDHHADCLNSFATKAFDLHYKATKIDEIEEFIQNVIQGKDPMRTEREQFYNDCLLPPNGKTACQNIINAILGEEEYK